MADKKTPPTPVTETPAPVERKRNPIFAYTVNDGGALSVAEPRGFSDYPQFRAWVAKNGENGVTYLPLRKVGKELTPTTITKTALV